MEGEADVDSNAAGETPKTELFETLQGDRQRTRVTL